VRIRQAHALGRSLVFCPLPGSTQNTRGPRNNAEPRSAHETLGLRSSHDFKGQSTAAIQCAFLLCRASWTNKLIWNWSAPTSAHPPSKRVPSVCRPTHTLYAYIIVDDARIDVTFDAEDGSMLRSLLDQRTIESSPSYYSNSFCGQRPASVPALNIVVQIVGSRGTSSDLARWINSHHLA
jgi:hypothetical protein